MSLQKQFCVDSKALKESLAKGIEGCYLRAKQLKTVNVFGSQKEPTKLLHFLFFPAADEPTETDLLRGKGTQDSRHLMGWALTLQQLRALFTKRFLYAQRSTRGFLAQV